MSDTADRAKAQAASMAVADDVESRIARIVAAGCDRSPRDTAAIIIMALHTAGYVIVPRAAVAAALERKEAAV